MVGEMVQNSQSLYSFTFMAVIVIHEYIYSSHSTTVYIQEIYLFTFNDIFLIHEYIYSHLRDVSFTFNGLYPFTFTIQIFIQLGAIFIQHFLRTPFAHH